MLRDFSFSSNQSGSSPNAWRLVLALLLLSIAANVYTVAGHFSVTALDFDASHFYLPYAQRLLSEGLSFFADPQSVRYPPMAYVYPALLGANQLAVKVGNIVLSCALIVALFRIGSLLHSRQAGLCIAFLFALSPLFRTVIPRVLTEPVFLFLVGIWLLCVTETIVNRRIRLAAVGGIAFGLAILSRGSFYYFAYAVAIVATMMMLRSRDESRRVWKNVLAMHLIALIFPLAFILKNWLLFDYPFFATGIGNALYFGSHPLVNGYELPYYGLDYDEGAVTLDNDHLGFIGERLLRGVAQTMVAERPWFDLIASYVQKTGAFVFVTKAELADSVWNIRSLRIAEVVLGMVGLLAIRPRSMQLLVGGALAYQIAVHIPLLYSHRYSVGAIDLWLVLLAGVGMSVLLKSRDMRKAAGILTLVLVGIGWGELHRKYSSPLAPDIDRVPHEVIWRLPGKEASSFANNSFVATDPGKFRLGPGPVALDIPVHSGPKLNQYGNYVLTLRLAVSAERQGSCKEMRVSYKRLADPGFVDGQSVMRRISADGQFRSYHIGATMPLAMNAMGDIRLSFECPAGTLVSIDEFSIAEPKVAITYKQLYLSRLDGKTQR